MSHDNIKEIKPSKDLAIKCIAAVTDAIAEKFGCEPEDLVFYNGALCPLTASFIKKDTDDEEKIPLEGR